MNYSTTRLKMWLIQVLLLLAWLISLDGTITSIPTGYISYYSSSIINTKTTLASPSKYDNLTVLMRADDSPFEAIPLPFGFNFFGSNINYVYASPNGGLHTSLDQPCYCGYTASYCFGTQDCTFASSYYGVIAGVLTDLYPVDSTRTDSNIIVSTSTDYVSVRYQDIRVCTTNPYYNTFDIDLFRDGHVEIIYHIISLPSSLKYNGFLSSGLRAPKYLNDKYGYLTASQISLSSSPWKSVSGVYPPSTSSISTDNQFTICPISLLWCANPSTVTQSSNMNFTIHPAAIGCGSELEIMLYPGSSTTTTVLSNNVNIIPCTNSNNNFNGDADDTFECDGSTYFQSLTSGVTIDLYLYWRLLGSTSTTSYNLISFVDPIAIRITASGSSSDCAYNEVNGDSLDNSCVACDICNRDFSCLSSLECEVNALPVVFQYPDCNNTCIYDSNINLYNYLQNSTLGEDCCPFDEVDCAGECGGSAIVTNSSNALVDLTCCLAEDVDCYGVCYGEGEVDACGVCDGDDEYGTTCDLGYTIYGIDNNVAEAIVDVSTDMLYTLVVVNITNTNSTYINVALATSSSNNDDNLGPDVTFVENNINIPGNDSALFHINVSFYSLSQGSKTLWQSKKVTLSIKRPSFSSTYVKRTFTIHPKAINCGNLTLRPCIYLPGCFYCTEYEGLRVLLEEDTKVKANRSLYTAIIPPEEGTLKLSDEDGYCIDGWNTASCPDINGAASRYGYTPSVYVIISIFLCILILH